MILRFELIGAFLKAIWFKFESDRGLKIKPSTMFGHIDAVYIFLASYGESLVMYFWKIIHTQGLYQTLHLTICWGFFHEQLRCIFCSFSDLKFCAQRHFFQAQLPLLVHSVEFYAWNHFSSGARIWHWASNALARMCLRVSNALAQMRRWASNALLRLAWTTDSGGHFGWFWGLVGSPAVKVAWPNPGDGLCSMMQQNWLVRKFLGLFNANTTSNLKSFL